jgi:hypothetical protein
VPVPAPETRWTLRFELELDVANGRRGSTMGSGMGATPRLVASFPGAVPDALRARKSGAERDVDALACSAAASLGPGPGMGDPVALRRASRKAATLMRWLASLLVLVVRRWAAGRGGRSVSVSGEGARMWRKDLRLNEEGDEGGDGREGRTDDCC